MKQKKILCEKYKKKTFYLNRLLLIRSRWLNKELPFETLIFEIIESTFEMLKSINRNKYIHEQRDLKFEIQVKMYFKKKIKIQRKYDVLC